jgi:ketosteroid isomerase-like protein
MPRTPQPPTALAISFVDRINRGDLDGLTALMTADHTLVVLDEPPLVGRDANRAAWSGYFTTCPDYVIHPRRIAVAGASVALLGVTTGSHLALPDEEELRLTVIWVADTTGGLVSRWRVAEDTAELRARTGLGTPL